MRLVIQVASSAQVRVAGAVVGTLPSPGLVILVGVTHDDDAEVAARLASKVWTMRILDGDRSASDINAPLLVVSQFTLYADTKKGRRPSWNAAAPAAIAQPLVAQFANTLTALGAHVEQGVFGAHMEVALVGDGPVTIIVDST